MILDYIRKTIGLLALTSIFLTPQSVVDAQENAKTPSSKVYELRFYVTLPGKLDALHNRFKNHTMKLFEKHSMENVIYWTVAEGTKADGDKSKNMLVYIVAHKDLSAKDASWKAFGSDPEWHRVQSESEKDGKILAEAPRSILMTETEFSNLDWPENGKSNEAASLFELRHYNDGPARVPFTVERFGFGETKLFTDAGMKTVKFWRAMDDSAFIYLLAHKDRETSKSSWGTFMKSFPAFLEKYNAEKKGPPKDAPNGTGHEVRFLVPTDYSPRK